MGSKSGGGTYNSERPLSAQELRLLSTQGDMMDAGIAMADEQNARSKEQYQQWKDSYEGVETGMIDNNAVRENGYTNGMTGKYAPSPSVAMRREGAMYGNQTQANAGEIVACSNCGNLAHEGSACGSCGNPAP